MTLQYKIQDFQDSKVFCPAPFVHYYIHSTEKSKPCCFAHKYDVWKQPRVVRKLEEEWESEDYTKLRNNMIQGKASRICTRCYDAESTGGNSDRLNFMRTYMEVEPTLEINVETGNEYGTPLDLDLRPGNLCNLQCRMCGTATSSQLNKEAKKNQSLLKNVISPFDEENESVWTSDDNLDFLLKNIDKGPRLIKFLGGEPTIMPEVDRILDILIERDRTDIDIFFTTNLTNTNKNFLDKISNFRETKWNISMDGIDKTLEYIRYPVKWYSLQKNLIKLSQLGNIAKTIPISYTLQAYNIFDLEHTIRWAHNRNKENEVKLYVDPDILVHPKFFSYNVLPKDVRDKAVEKILKMPELEEQDTLNKIRTRVEYILNDETKGHLKTFANATKRLDISRKQHIKDYIPELWEVIEKDYNDIQV